MAFPPDYDEFPPKMATSLHACWSLDQSSPSSHTEAVAYSSAELFCPLVKLLPSGDLDMKSYKAQSYGVSKHKFVKWAIWSSEATLAASPLFQDLYILCSC